MSVILMYHSIVTNVENELMEVRLETIEKHLYWLSQLGYQIASLSELLNSERDNLAAITFDDAYEDFLKVVPLFQRLNLPLSLFMCPGDLGKTNYWATVSRNNKKLLHKSQIVDINKIQNKLDILPHGWMHIRMTEISDFTLTNNLKKTIQWFAEILNKKPEILSYPYGLINLISADIISKYFKFGLAVDITENFDKRRFCIPRIQAIETMTYDWLVRQCSIKNTFHFI